jgi:hypothetical protein
MNNPELRRIGSLCDVSVLTRVHGEHRHTGVSDDMITEALGYFDKPTKQEDGYFCRSHDFKKNIGPCFCAKLDTYDQPAVFYPRLVYENITLWAPYVRKQPSLSSVLSVYIECVEDYYVISTSFIGGIAPPLPGNQQAITNDKDYRGSLTFWLGDYGQSFGHALIKENNDTRTDFDSGTASIPKSYFWKPTK